VVGCIAQFPDACVYNFDRDEFDATISKFPVRKDSKQATPAQPGAGVRHLLIADFNLRLFSPRER